ncbi:MAG: trans-sulfuration enzyme family protein, partial [Sediminibacterium sp.]
AHQHNCQLCVDNTFATPVLQQPISLGADIVVHSATKYLAGHSDLIAGLVVAADAEIGKRLQYFQNACGAILSPFDSWLVIRGLETLHLRIRQHSKTALEIATRLQDHPAIRKVNYPGLTTHPNHLIAAQQATGFGGMISFVLLENTEEAARDIITGTRLFKLAESLGGIKSLISHPASMTHKTIPVAKRRAAGIEDGLIRLSIGLEDAADLFDDLNETLNRVTNYSTDKIHQEPALI